MNNNNVKEIKIELDKLNRIPEVDEIAQLDMKEFNSKWLQREYQKITNARDKKFPTHRSEYRVIKTLIRQRNELIYYFDNTYPDDRVLSIKTEFVKISKLLASMLKSISEIFEKEKNITTAVDKYEREFNIIN